MRKPILAGVAAGAVLAVGGVVAVDGLTEPADAQTSRFEVSPEQLKINQNISSAAVRRSNRSLNYLAPIRTTASDNADDGTNGVTALSAVAGSGQGWTTAQIANGAVTGEKVSGDLQGDIGYYANVQGSGALASNRGAQSAGRTGTGEYTVTFAQSLAQCSVAGSPMGATGSEPSAEIVKAYVNAANNAQALVRTYDVEDDAANSNLGLADSDFTLQVTC